MNKTPFRTANKPSIIVEAKCLETDDLARQLQPINDPKSNLLILLEAPSDDLNRFGSHLIHMNGRPQKNPLNS